MINAHTVRNHRHTTAVLDVPSRSCCYLATIDHRPACAAGRGRCGT
jgi:hypothetical protein